MTPTTQKTRGLCFDRKHQSWRCRIFYAGKQRHIGRFRDALDAAKAYDRAAFYLYGEKAILNFSMEEAAADQGSVPLFIRQAKEQAEAAAALAEAMGEAADGSASASGSGIVSALRAQGSVAAAAAAAAGLTASMQPQTEWKQILMQQPQQQPQQQQVYVLDAYGNIVCQPATSTTSSLQQLQQQQLDAYGNPACQPVFLHSPTAMQQQLDACGNLLGYQPVALQSPCSMQQQQLTSSPLPLSTAWSSPGSLAHAELAVVPPGLLLGNYSVTDSTSSMMYAHGDACIPISSCVDARLYSSSGSTCSSQPAAITAAMLHHSLAPVTLSSMHGSNALPVLPQAAGTAAGFGGMQQLAAPRDMHIGDSTALRQTLQWQLQKQQSLPQPGQRVHGLTTSPPAQPGAYLNSSSSSAAPPQASLGLNGSMGPLQQQSPAAAASGNVQVLHMPAMPMPTVQQHVRPAALPGQRAAAQKHVLLTAAHAQAATSTAATAAYGTNYALAQAATSQQQLSYGCNVLAAPPQLFGAAQCAPQQQQGMPAVSVDCLSGMIQAGALQL